MISRVISRLKSVPINSSVWDALPYTRRAAVLVVIFRNKYGNIGTLLTVRSSHLKSFSGDAALPGGQSDHDYETAYQVARREAQEEVDLSMDNEKLMAQGINVEFLTNLPSYLSRNLLAVRPSVVYLSGDGFLIDRHTNCPNIFKPAYDEVKEVFSIPLERFLSDAPGWYSGQQVNWGGLTWNQHWFRSIRPTKNIGEVGWINVWGLTANIMVDIARLAYQKEPPMLHRKPGVFGDEELIKALYDKGLLPAKRDKRADLRVNFAKVFGSDSPLLDGRKAV